MWPHLEEALATWPATTSSVKCEDACMYYDHADCWYIHSSHPTYIHNFMNSVPSCSDVLVCMHNVIPGYCVAMVPAALCLCSPPWCSRPPSKWIVWRGSTGEWHSTPPDPQNPTCRTSHCACSFPSSCGGQSPGLFDTSRCPRPHPQWTECLNEKKVSV